MIRFATAAAILLLPLTGASAQSDAGSGQWGMLGQPGMMGPRMMGPGQWGMMGQPGIMGPGMMGPGMLGNMSRHHQAMMYGIPRPYSALRDPLPNTAATLRRGAAVFQQNCASCHGLQGRGDGPAGVELVPPPANLAWLAHTPMSRSDPYMYWTIAEGGKALGSNMPAFTGTLPKNDIWSVIAYIREGLGSPR